MWTVYAVNIATEEKDEYENEDFICFEESEREQAEQFASEHNSEVEEWTLLYRFELFECNWRQQATVTTTHTTPHSPASPRR